MDTYALGEELWMMYNNAPKKVKVVKVFIAIDNNGTHTYYKVSIFKGYDEVTHNDLYRTKELLLNSFL